MEYRSRKELLDALAELPGFGKGTLKHLNNGLKMSDLDREEDHYNLARAIRELTRACMMSVKLEVSQRAIAAVQGAGSFSGLSSDRINELVGSISSMSRVLCGKLFEASILVVIIHKLGPLGWTVEVQVKNIEDNRGGHIDIVIHSPNGNSYILEAKTSLGTAYKVPLFEHTEYPFYLVTLGLPGSTLSPNQIKIMQEFGCQPVVVHDKHAGKEGVMTFDEMIAEMRDDDENSGTPAPKAAHA